MEKKFTKKQILIAVGIFVVVLLAVAFIVIFVSQDIRKREEKESVHEIIDLARDYFKTEKENITYHVNILNQLNYHGRKPKEGSVVGINEQGEVALALLFKDACYRKEYYKDTIMLGDVDNCTVDISSHSVVTLKNVLESSTIVTSGPGLYKSGQKYRFRGGCTITETDASPTCVDEDSIDNYISVYGEIYRIISMDNRGVKVITQDSVLDLAYDEGNGSRNNEENSFCQGANACNAYAAPIGGTFASLQRKGTVADNSSLYEYLNAKSTDSAITTLRNVAQSTDWSIGAVEGNDALSLTAVIQTQENASKANFKIGLLNISDYIEGSTDLKCPVFPLSYGPESGSCSNQNWLYHPSAGNFWTVNAWGDSDTQNEAVWVLDVSAKSFVKESADAIHAVRPAAYLPGDIKVTGGSGTETDPWVLVP